MQFGLREPSGAEKTKKLAAALATGRLQYGPHVQRPEEKTLTMFQ